MNDRNLARVAMLVLTGIALPLAATAAESVLQQADRCSKVLGERERLVCFDRVFPLDTRASELPSRVAPAGASVAAPAATVADAAPVAPAVTSSFADDTVKTRAKSAKSAAENNSMTAQISAMTETRPNVWRLSLDNGQVWQQQEMSYGFLPKAGNTLRIDRGRMGGYSMALIGESRSPWVRATRVQ